MIHGRALSAGDIGLIQGLLAEHRDWGRTRLSQELCRLWDWRHARGRMQAMAARTVLRKLEHAGHVRLPPRQPHGPNGIRNRHPAFVPHASEPIRCALGDLRPLAVSVVEPGSEDLRLFNGRLSRSHYLGHRNTFVDRERFRGTCYQAANWAQIGATQGRSRNDRQHGIRVSVKDVYLYPRIQDFRRELCAC